MQLFYFCSFFNVVIMLEEQQTANYKTTILTMYNAKQYCILPSTLSSVSLLSSS